MKVGVIYDFGVNKGGGDYVLLNILATLHNSGYDVSLITSNPSGLYEAVELFNENIPNVNVCEIEAPRFLKHPYTIAYISKKAIKGRNCDIYVTSDDIPKCLSDKRGVCYIHFSHAARFRFQEYVASKYKRTLSGKLRWWIHKGLFQKFYLKDDIPNGWLLIANSIVTKRRTSETFHMIAGDIAVLNPPVDSVRINKLWRNSDIEKENLVVCIGRFEPEKKFVDVLHAMASLKDEIRLSLIGFSQAENELIKLIKNFRLERSVKLLVNASRETLISELIKAKAIIHPTPNEPFGIAVVEGMAAGCIPIVRKGFNGPWMEITQEGRYGLGFSSTEELASAIEGVIERYKSFDIEGLTSRALEFDKAEFRLKFLKIIENF